MSRWRALVLVLVHVAIVAHVLHWRSRGQTLSPLEPSEAIQFSQNSVVNAGLILFAGSILFTAIFGRFFCGWGCHIIAVQDLCLWLLKKVGIRPRPMHSRALLLVPFAAFAYMFLYPPLYRMWRGIDFREPTLELTTASFWETFPPWPVAVVTILVSGFAVVYFLGAKGFCTYACPYGAIFSAAARFSPGAIRASAVCEGCAHCTQVCTSNVAVNTEIREYGMVVDPGCMKCLDCVSVCPNDALYFGFGKPPIVAKRRKSRRPSKRWAWWKMIRWRSYTIYEELGLAVLFVLAFATFRGLYGTVPFLLSLAMAGIFAFCTLQLVRLAYKTGLKLQNVTIKQYGRLTFKGVAFVGAMVVMIAATVHSAVVQLHGRAAEARFDELDAVVTSWLREPRTLTEHQRTVAAEAIEHAEAVERIAPLAWFPREGWRLAMIRGWMNLILGNEDAFRLELERAVELVPDDPVPHDGMANYHAAAGRRDEADFWFEKATSVAPGVESTWLNRSRWLSGTGRRGEARAVLETAAVELTDPAQAFHELGMLEYAGGDPEAAVGAFERSLAVDPGRFDTLLLLAGLHCDMGEFSKGTDSYEKALLQRPEDPRTRLLAARAYTEMGELDRAEAHAEAARIIAPDNPLPWVAMSRIARLRGNTAEAERLEEEARQRSAAARE